MADGADRGSDRPGEVAGTDRRPRDRWVLIFAAGLAVFMASVDMSIVNVSLAAIEQDFGVPTSATTWVVLSYLFPLVGLALPSGRWLDSVGQRAALSFSVTGFAVASAASGLAPDIGWLLGARVLQGTFGALLFSLVPALATTAVRPEARGRAMGLITTMGPIGLVSGPALGGLLVDGLGWPWIFYVNVPVSVLVLLVGLWTLPPGRPLRVPDRSWIVESVLLSGAVAALLLALSLTADVGPAWLALALVCVPLLLVWRSLPVSFAVRELLGTRGVLAPHLALAAAATCIGAVFFISPFYLQRVLDTSVAVAGTTVLAFPAAMAIFGPLGGVLADWLGARRVALLGALLFTVGLLFLLPLGDTWTPLDLAWRLFLAGMGNGLFNAPNMTMAMTHAPQRLLATAGASTSLSRQLGFALGPALATVTWSAFGYELGGMQATVGVAAGVSALSVMVLAVWGVSLAFDTTGPQSSGASKG